MRRIQASAAVLLGLAVAVLPGAGYAAEQPSSVATADDCGAGAGSETDTTVFDGEVVTITTDNFGSCLTAASNSVAVADSTAGAPPALPVAGRPAFTG